MSSNLTINNLVVLREQKQVLHGISLDFKPGEITAIVGANGAGKSSAVLAISGAIPVKQGEVLWQGKNIAGQSADQIRRSGLALVAEGHQVLGDLTVLDNLKVAASHLPANEVSSAVDEALQLFPELTTRLDVPAGALSGGQKQMVLIGQALISNPQFILVDELSLGLAPAIVNRLAIALDKLAQSGMGIILIEQFTTLALKMARNTYVMERGQIVFSGASQQLQENPEILHSAYLSVS